MLTQFSQLDRRGALARLLGGAAAVAAGGLAACSRATVGGGAAAAPVQAAAGRAAAQWDDTWTERLHRRRSMVFDAAEIAGGIVLFQASAYLQGYSDVFGTVAGAATAVAVIRHAAVPMIMQDDAWRRLSIGAKRKLKDPASGEDATRNPFLAANVRAGDQHAMINPGGGVDGLIARGAIVLTCSIALGNYAAILARDEGIDAREAREYIMSHIVPGVVVLPSGIYAVARAQEAGCQYIKSS